MKNWKILCNVKIKYKNMQIEWNRKNKNLENWKAEF